MKKIILLISILFIAIQTNAQKNKLAGHWLIIKMSMPGESIEITPQYFEKKMFKIMSDTLKRALTAPDSLRIKEAANEAYKELAGTYFQFNPDGTFAASYQAGDVQKGTYTVNERKHSIILMGTKKETWYYAFKADILNLTSDDGQMDVDLIKK